MSKQLKEFAMILTGRDDRLEELAGGSGLLSRDSEGIEAASCRDPTPLPEVFQDGKFAVVEWDFGPDNILTIKTDGNKVFWCATTGGEQWTGVSTLPAEFQRIIATAKSKI